MPRRARETWGVPGSEPRRQYLEVASEVYPPVYQHQPPPLPHGYRSDRPIRLHEIDLYVTMRCNIRCHFCNVRAGQYQHPDLPLPRILALIDEARGLGLEEIHFLGGEPCLRPDLEEMVGYAHRAGLHTRIITNGMLLPQPRLIRLIEAGLRQIMISVDGLEESHNRLRECSPAGWQTTVECVRRAVGLGLPTRVSMVAYRDNLEDVVPLLRLVESWGANIFSVFLGSPLGRGQERASQVIDAYAWRQLQRQVEAEARQLRPDFQVIMEQGFAWTDEPAVDRAQLKGRGTGCNTLLEDLDYLIVRSDGHLYQCVFFMTEGKPLGNVLHQPLRETLQHALDLAEYRPFTVANDHCVDCLHQQECGTGCRGYAYLYRQDWLKTDPRCAKGPGGTPVGPPAGLAGSPHRPPGGGTPVGPPAGLAGSPHRPPGGGTPAYYPLCPILKANLRTGRYGGSSEQALEGPPAGGVGMVQPC